MPQDAFHIRRLTIELNALLTGAKINKISQSSKDELTFTVYTGKTTVKLLVSAHATGARVCLSSLEKEPLAVSPNFCMLLRKHLQNAEILGFSQPLHERIIEITLHCTTDFSESRRTLVCELMGKYSNIVLVENGVILGALKNAPLTDENHRVLLPGVKYAYPTPQGKISPVDETQIRSVLHAFFASHQESYEQETLAKFFFEEVAGYALSTARELVSRGKTAPDLAKFAVDFFENEPCKPCITENDYFAFEISGAKAMPSLMKAEDEFYSSRESNKAFADKKRKLESAVHTFRKKAQKRLQETLERLKDADKAEENRVKGELLTANIYRVEKGAKSVELENWYDGKTVKIALDETRTPAQNAQKYFKIYNKQKRAKEVLMPMQKRDEREIEYAGSVSFSIARAETFDDLKEIETELVGLGLMREPVKKIGAKKQAEIPFREFEKDGFCVLVGRNNLQNDRLVKSASAEDIWLHAQKYHSAHVIIKTEGKTVPDSVLLFAAQLCAYYSEGKEADKIPIDYCKKKTVKKPHGSKAGFVTYTDYKTLLVRPQKETNE